MRREQERFDLCFLGHYTRDTIVAAAGTRVVDGGAFYYGANVAARMGLKTAAVTRLAEQDFAVVRRLEALGVTVFARRTQQSTCLRLEYPTANPDHRVIYITGSAGPFTLAEARDVEARAFVLGGSVRGEIGIALVRALARRDTRIAADVQGFVRVNRDGRLVNADWPGMREMLGLLDVVKADAVEAERLTGQSDLYAAAEALRALGPVEVVLTHRDGVLVDWDGKFYRAPFLPKKLVGRSGRGDTCIAAYMAARLNRTPAASTVWAAAVTSLKMESDGPFDRNMAAVEALIRAEYGES